MEHATTIPVWYRRSICDLMHGMHRAAGASPHIPATDSVEERIFSTSLLPLVVSVFNCSLSGISEAVGIESVGHALQTAYTHLQELLEKPHEVRSDPAPGRAPRNDFREDVEVLAKWMIQSDCLGSDRIGFYGVAEMQTLFTIFMNNAVLNGTCQITNTQHCQNRVWQKLNEWSIEGYQPSPPFADWECEQW